MTRAPANLRAVRHLYLAYLDTHPGRRLDDDLDPDEVGIVGDTRHKNHGDSYHLGQPEQGRHGYSVDESPRDRGGLSEDACAVDVGWFEVTVNGHRHNLRTYSVWLVAQCEAGTPDTRDIREVIYSPDGRTVRRWDRLRRRSSGSRDHLFHTHKSYFRDAIAAGRDQTPVVRRYLTEIGLLEDDVTKDDIRDAVLEALGTALPLGANGPAKRLATDGWARNMSVLGLLAYCFEHAVDPDLVTGLAAVRKDLATLTGADPVDEDRLAARLLAVLTPAAIAAALPPQIAAQVADEIASRLQHQD